MNLSVNVGSIELKNPVMTASGTFGFGLEFSPYGDITSLGGIVVKGISLKPREGNPMPRIAETPCGMLNAIGIQNPGVDVFVNKILPTLPVSKTAVVANLYGRNAAEFAQLADILAQAGGLAALEVNVSCPNVSQGGILFGQDPTMITRVTVAVKEQARDVPVWVKLSPNVTDIAACARAAEAGGADAITLINTLSGMGVELRERRPLLANVIGGLSGPAIKPVALRCVWQASQAVDIPVVGIGGISSAVDVLEFILVGASAVQVGTANFHRPDTAFRIIADLPLAMERGGVSSLDELRGSLNREVYPDH